MNPFMEVGIGEVGVRSRERHQPRFDAIKEEDRVALRATSALIWKARLGRANRSGEQQRDIPCPDTTALFDRLSLSEAQRATLAGAEISLRLYADNRNTETRSGFVFAEWTSDASSAEETFRRDTVFQFAANKPVEGVEASGGLYVGRHHADVVAGSAEHVDIATIVSCFLPATSSAPAAS